MTIDQLHDVESEKVGEDLARLTPDRTLTYESVLRTKGERNIPVEVYASQVDIDGVQRIQWILRDITERKDLEHLREDLTFMIYHDLRSPLANVNYSLEALSGMLPLEEDPTLKSLIDVTKRSTDRIQRLTNSLLDIQKLEAGQAIAKQEPIAVPDLIEESFDTVKSIAEGKKQALEAVIPEGLPKVNVDVDMIRRVLINLIENAIKFNKSDGKVTVEAKQEDGWVYISVADQGPGIPLEEYENIFNKYVRLSSQTQGFGLGLAFCQLAVEAHGGQIRVDSEPDEGAIFTFSLPIVEF
jgi:signal transduction histidine kinase